MPEFQGTAHYSYSLVGHTCQRDLQPVHTDRHSRKPLEEQPHPMHMFTWSSRLAYKRRPPLAPSFDPLVAARRTVSETYWDRLNWGFALEARAMGFCNSMDVTLPSTNSAHRTASNYQWTNTAKNSQSGHLLWLTILLGA